jgi:SAM-dependent methyltransferase
MIQRSEMSYGEEQAAAYEGDSEHMLPPEEADVWLAEMGALAGVARPSGRLLDVGAGTGLLTAVMKEAGVAVTGLEPSASMIEQALKRNALLKRADFILGHADDSGLFESESFDWIVSRQVLCHLSEPEKVFTLWHRWLTPGGHMMVVDGFWPRSSWRDAELSKQPFASLSSAKPVVDALSAAGFHVVKAGTFSKLNAARKARWPSSVERYAVVATRQ